MPETYVCVIFATDKLLFFFSRIGGYISRWTLNSTHNLRQPQKDILA